MRRAGCLQADGRAACVMSVIGVTWARWGSCTQFQSPGLLLGLALAPGQALVIPGHLAVTQQAVWSLEVSGLQAQPRLSEDLHVSSVWIWGRRSPPSTGLGHKAEHPLSRRERLLLGRHVVGLYAAASAGGRRPACCRVCWLGGDSAVSG